MSNKRLVTMQIGKEVTPFTAVAATARLMELDDMPKVAYDGNSELLMDQAGTLNPGSYAVFNGGMSTITWGGTATYQDIQYWLDGLFGTVTPTGAGPYVYATNAPLTPLPTLRRYTVEFGDTISGGPNYKFVGGLLNKFSLETKPREKVKYSCEMLAGQASTVTMAALSSRTQTPLHNSQVSIYMDTWAGTLGSTALTATAQEFKIEFDAKRNLAWLSGDLFPTDHDEDIVEVKFSGVLKFNATSKSLFEELIGSAITQKQFRFKFTTGANAIAQFDIPALMSAKVDMWSERNTTVMVGIEGTAMYHSTVANYFKASITNQVATLP